MFSTTLGKKYIMALTGIVLIGFVFVHMAGNLQMFAGQEYINKYAYNLQSLPWFVLWGSRLFLLVCVVLHAFTAYALIAENRKARPQGNQIEVTKKAGWSSLYMGLTGTILLAFIVFHLLHFTIRLVFPEYNDLKTIVGSPDDSEIQDVYKMVLAGFRFEAVSIFYVVSMFLLCRHLSHGVSSVFQSLGIRSESWRSKLQMASEAYSWIIFAGFSAIPIAVLAQEYGIFTFFDERVFSSASLLH